MEAPSVGSPNELNVGDWVIFPMRGILAHDPIRLRVAEIDQENGTMLVEQHCPPLGHLKIRQPLNALAEQMGQFRHQHIRASDAE